MDNALSFERLQAELLLAIQHAMMLASPQDSDLTIATRLYFAESRLLRQLARHVLVSTSARRSGTYANAPHRPSNCLFPR